MHVEAHLETFVLEAFDSLGQLGILDDLRDCGELRVDGLVAKSDAEVAAALPKMVHDESTGVGEVFAKRAMYRPSQPPPQPFPVACAYDDSSAPPSDAVETDDDSRVSSDGGSRSSSSSA